MLYPSFKDIFRSSLEDACSSYNYKMSNELKSYLIKLCAEDLLKTSAQRPDGMIDPLILLGEIPKTTETLEYLKLNGDYHLSIAGYIPEAFCNKFSEFDYHLLIGRYSYYRLHQVLPKEKLYKDLSYDYLQIIYILNETFDTIKIHSDSNMLKIWEAWKITGHPIFRKKLARRGMNPEEISC